ncbi:MAG: hypothetical protein IKU47_03420 [Oscillospiraceae bacterium]|nr:hypothetical protein [Oscillospiraceae bacterium]
MTAKQYLRQGYKLNERIQDKQERLAQFKELAISIGAMDYSKDRVQGGSGTDAPFENQIIKVVDLEAEIKADIKRLCELQVEISNAVKAVEEKDVNCYLVLSKRYLLMNGWNMIADEMGYSKEQIHRFHRKGLKLIEIPER